LRRFLCDLCETLANFAVKCLKGIGQKAFNRKDREGFAKAAKKVSSSCLHSAWLKADG